MSTVQEIVTAAAKLDAQQFVQLREELDRLEQALWQAELERTSEELAKVSDDDIDRMVVKRRRESRS